MNSEEVKNATEMTYDEATQKFTYTGDFEANKNYVFKLTNTSGVALGGIDKGSASFFMPVDSNGKPFSNPPQPGDVVYVLVQYATAMNDTIALTCTQ